ncbi:MAG: TIGR03790 family protein [Spartobacteria bacterium]|nr:TIGR03790 family protein [Spartobacteria bacterium]
MRIKLTYLFSVILWIITTFNSPSLAGINPLHTLVVVNDNSANAQALGHYYRSQWNIPFQNVCHISATTNYTILAVDYTNQIYTPIQDYIQLAGLSNQIDCIVLCGDMPYRISSYSGAAFDMNGLPSVLYYGYHTAAPPCELPSSTSNRYYATEHFFTNNTANPGQPASICSFLTGWTFDQARQVVDRSKQATFSSPPGVIYMLHTIDTDRSIQWPRYNNTDFACRFIDAPLTCDIRDANTLSGVTNIAAYMLGLPSIIWDILSNQFVPGALGNLVTSFGGNLFENNEMIQMSILTWLRAGCAGSYGTCREPCAYTQKFPDPLIHYYYARGFSLGECFYMAIQSPYEGVVVGDPLCTPYAHPAALAVTGLASNSTVSNAVSLTISAQAADANKPVGRIDVYLDGYFHQTIFEARPEASNTVSVTIDGTTRSVTVNKDEALYSVVSRLASQLNASPPLNILATPVSDRLSIRQTTLGIPATNIGVSTAMSIGTGTNLNLFSYSPETHFLETRYQAREQVTLEGGIISGDVVTVIITTLDHQTVTNRVTAQTNMIPYLFMTNLMHVINTDPALTGSDGCEMKYAKGFGTSTDAHFFSRTNSWEGSGLYLNYQVQPAPGSPLTNSSFSDYFNDNADDLYGRAMVFLGCGASNADVAFSLDPATLGLSDGPHTLQVAAREGTAVGTVALLEVPFEVRRNDLACLLSTPAPYANFSRGQVITATVETVTGSGAVTQTALRAGGRVVAVTNTSTAIFAVSTTNIGAGAIPFQGTAWRDDGAVTDSEITWVRIYLDTDTNSLPDWWTYQYFGTSTNVPAAEDPDADSCITLSEYIADTDPTNTHSYFHVSITPATNQIKLDYISSLYRNYTVHYSDGPITDAHAWSLADTNIYQGEPGSACWYNNSTNGPLLTNTLRFYRIKAIVP